MILKKGDLCKKSIVPFWGEQLIWKNNKLN